MEHQLLRFNSYYVCTQCKSSWKSKPRSICPGVPRHDLPTKPNNLLSKSHLALAGFALAPDQPCRVMGLSVNGRLYPLFDINEAISKKGRSPIEGLRILESKLARKEYQAQKKLFFEELDKSLAFVDRALSILNSSLERYSAAAQCISAGGSDSENPENPHGPAVRIKSSLLKASARGLRSILEEGAYLVGPQPQSGDMVLGDKEKEPRLGDMVLGEGYSQPG